MAQQISIGIAGAGIGGLAAAALLAGEGHRVTLFDQFEAAGPVGSGLMLQETGLAVLGAMGLRAQTEALGTPIARLHGISVDTGRAVLDVRYGALREGLAGLGIQRAALFGLLQEAAVTAGARLVPATRMISADAGAGTLTDAGGGLHGPYDLVIDALGVRSPLSSAPREELAYGALWATLPWPATSAFDRAALEQRYEAARKMAGVMPSGRAAAGAPDSLTYFWSIRADQYEAFRATPLSHWKDAACHLWPETEALLHQITDHDQLTFARYRHRTHPRAVEGRLVHIGDAWHAASPQLGQGANMALLDAYALAHALHGEARIAAALRRFLKIRAGHVRLYQLMTWAFTPVYQSDGALTPWLRDRLAAPMLRLWPAPPLLAGLVAGGFGAPLKKMALKAEC
ncbi:MAG: FAD-dependent monooxygenase [Alphaproteobacteria bacterium HGW-Alphaproteobacteria-18]|nr:MAG: FAD-dependent monooxygenase [Alphaproteobacteria bacterium HGW-Alphaproteobacteria-18]